MKCLLVLPTFSRIATGTAKEHIEYVRREERTELTNCNIPTCVSIEDIDVNCLSTLFIRGAKCSTFGFVVPIGKPRYVKDIPWMLHPITPARGSAFCGLMFRG
jgi:hypothetical protein